MALASNLVQIGISARQADFLGDTQEDAITATGIILANAYQLTKSINRITTAVAGVNDAVKLPSIGSTKYSALVIRNDTAAIVQVFPGSATEAINAGAGGAAINLAAGAGALFAIVEASRWVQI